MFDSLWKNVTLATMKGGFGIINNAALGLRDGKIAYAGPEKGLPGAPDGLSDYVYDGEGRVMTPGLIDCHTHLAYAGNRAHEFEQRLQGVSYEDIARQGGGIVSTVTATRQAGEDEIFALTLKRLNYLFREGVTGMEVKSGYGLDAETEKKLLRVATRLEKETGIKVQRSFLGAHALPPEFKGRADEFISAVCQMMEDIAKENLADAVDAYCENIGFTLEQTKAVFEKAKSLGLRVKLHAEQLSNMRGAALAAQYDALSADHLEYIDEDGVKAMAEKNMVAVLLPGAFYYLREKTLPPVDLFRKHGVKMAVATDHNPGTSPALSPVLMLNMACTLFRLTPEEAWLGMTAHAAQALGWQEEAGTLEAGKAANAALWDAEHPRDLCYTFGSNPCKGVLLQGAWHPFDAA